MASNGQAFIARVAEETGLELEVIDRETEAQLAVAGASPLIAPDAARVLLFDIGGGSTEVSWLTVEPGNYTIDAWTSVPEGVVTIAERFGGTTSRRNASPPCAVTSDRCCAISPAGWRRSTIAPCPTTCSAPPAPSPPSVASIWRCGAMIARGSTAAGCIATMSGASPAISWPWAMPIARRHPCIGAERADLVLAGCAILEEIKDCWPADRVRVADRGLSARESSPT